MTVGILAFSGGLDTSVVVKYLQEEHDMDVITVTVDVGQGDDKRSIAAKAKRLGVKKHYNIDAQDEFASDYVVPAIKANALYQEKYCLATALARPLIARKVVEVALKEGVQALAHGCSGKGNDQIRFDVAFRSQSDLPIIAPIRDKNLDRVTELAFARSHGIQIDTVAKRFSIDQNLWGRAIEGGVLEDPYAEPPDDAFLWVKTSDLADEPRYVEIGFEEGIPRSLDGAKAKPRRLVERLNRIAGEAGVGITEHMEDRVVGIKSREVYETPAALCLIEAHADLEKMVHTRHQNMFKPTVDAQWAYMAYSGFWTDPLMNDLGGFIQESQQNVTGTVRLKLYKGNMRVVGRRSVHSLYNQGMATYGTESTFNQKIAAGFAELWGAQTTEANKLQKGRPKRA